MTQEAKPGTWSDQTRVKDIKRQTREDERNARRFRKRLLADLLNRGEITPQFATFLSKIRSSTTDPENARLLKIQSIVATRNLMDQCHIAKRVTVYSGAGSDWRFPVALGARNILMLDNEYGSPDTRNTLYESLSEVYPTTNAQRTNNALIDFQIDLGKGLETVRMTLAPFAVEEFKSDTPIDFLLECDGPSQGLNIPIHENILRQMATNSLVLNLNYHHEVSYRPDSGMEAIQAGEFYIYRIIDPEKILTAYAEIPPPPNPDLGRLQNIHSKHRK